MKKKKDHILYYPFKCIVFIFTVVYFTVSFFSFISATRRLVPKTYLKIQTIVRFAGKKWNLQENCHVHTCFISMSDTAFLFVHTRNMFRLIDMYLEKECEKNNLSYISIPFSIVLVCNLGWNKMPVVPLVVVVSVYTATVVNMSTLMRYELMNRKITRGQAIITFSISMVRFCSFFLCIWII